MHIEYFNRAPGNLVFEGALKDACRSIDPHCEPVSWSRGQDIAERVDWDNRCDILVIHGDPKVEIQAGKPIIVSQKLKQLCGKASLRRSLRVVIVSSSTLIKKKDCCWRYTTGEKTLSVFSVHNTVGVGLGSLPPMPEEQKAGAARKWAEFLTAILDPSAVEAFFEKELTTDNARSIHHFVSGPASMSIIPALAILCQGYLAVHASADGRPEGVQNGEYERVSEALESMGWVTLCQSEEGRELLIEALRTDDDASRSVRAELRRKVTSVEGELWKSLAGENNLLMRFSNEWQSAKSGDLPENLKWLINRIAENKSIDDPGKVAQSYLDLSDALKA